MYYISSKRSNPFRAESFNSKCAPSLRFCSPNIRKIGKRWVEEVLFIVEFHKGLPNRAEDESSSTNGGMGSAQRSVSPSAGRTPTKRCSLFARRRICTTSIGWEVPDVQSPPLLFRSAMSAHPRSSREARGRLKPKGTSRELNVAWLHV